jgi:hypothetical protein
VNCWWEFSERLYGFLKYRQGLPDWTSNDYVIL